MRYLLLSVLVVSLVGVMIPSVFGQVGPNYSAEVPTLFGYGWMAWLIWIFLIVVPIALVILVVIAIKQYRRKKSS